MFDQVNAGPHHRQTMETLAGWTMHEVVTEFEVFRKYFPYGRFCFRSIQWSRFGYSTSILLAGGGEHEKCEGTLGILIVTTNTRIDYQGGSHTPSIYIHFIILELNVCFQ